MDYRMKRSLLLSMLSLYISISAFSQSKRDELYTDFVLYPKRALLEKDLHERIIGHSFAMPLDSNTEYKYESACHAVSQFLFATPEVVHGFTNLFAGYDLLSYDTKSAFLEAVYAVGKKDYATLMQAILDRETDSRLFSLTAVYLFRCDGSTDHANTLKIQMAEKFPGYDTVPILHELENYLSYHRAYMAANTPGIAGLFAWRGAGSGGLKTIYSFQRWARDYPGLALIQNADGGFVRDAQGRVQLFRQLARSGSDLPYFIRNGSTPQGIYSIRGLGVSHINFIGPTPNIQLILPNEEGWDRYFHLADSTADSLTRYRDLLPPGWREYMPMMEAWTAGKIGRTEIIAHGTTIDPEYFSDRPFYPLTPTMGCLCAKELWNPTSGHLLVSEQFNLVSAFESTPGDKGYLLVIDVDDQRKPVSREEVEEWIKQYEIGKK
jgi:hypothetical protein